MLSSSFFVTNIIYTICRFLKDEPDSIEDALKRCKRLTGTLFTLKRWDQCIIIALYPKKYCPLIQKWQHWVALILTFIQIFIALLPYIKRWKYWSPNIALLPDKYSPDEMRTITEHCPVSRQIKIAWGFPSTKQSLWYQGQRSKQQCNFQYKYTLNMIKITTVTGHLTVCL